MPLGQYGPESHGGAGTAGGIEGLRLGKRSHQGVDVDCQGHKEMISAHVDLLCILASTLTKEKLLGLVQQIAVRS